MPQIRDPFMWVARDQVFEAADLVLITAPIRERNQVMYVDEISVCNHDGTGGDVTIGLVQGGRFFPLDTIFNLIAGMWEYGHGKFTFLSEWQIYAQFHYETDGNGNPCDALDDCELHVIGYTLEEFTTP